MQKRVQKHLTTEQDTLEFLNEISSSYEVENPRRTQFLEDESGLSESVQADVFSPVLNEHTTKAIKPDVLKPTIKDLSVAVVRGLRVVFEQHGADPWICNELCKQVHLYLDICSCEKMWLSRAKHMLTYPIARYLKNTEPQLDDDKFRPTGALKRWMNPRFSLFNNKNTHLWYSWLQCKRAALPLSEEMIEDSYSKHQKALTSPDPGDDCMIEQIIANPTFQYVLKKFKKNFTLRMEEPNMFTTQTPSTSACFEETRSNGGASARLRAEAGIPLFSGDTELTSMKVIPRMVNPDGTISYNVVEESREPFGREMWNELNDTSYFYDLDRKLNAIIQAVLEPCKIRIISKGESVPYYASKLMQKALWSALQVFPCFKLTGKPFSSIDLCPLFETAERNWEWFSVDYSGATDGLSYKYSQAIMDLVVCDLPPHLQKLMRAVLGLHHLWYPSKDGLRDGGEQTNGQLMGSPLSFPFLCLANLGVYLLNTSELHQGWKHSKRLSSVLINGDDMVYAAPRRLWSEHARISGLVGLEMTVGKAYVHKKYVNVNSTCAHYDLSNPRSTPFLIPYFNTGLYFGQNKVLQKEDEVSSRCSVINRVLDGCLNEKTKLVVFDNYLRMHRECIERETRAKAVRQDNKECPFSRSLFLPESLGGMGVCAPSDWKFYISPIQRKVALTLIHLRGSALVDAELALPTFNKYHLTRSVVPEQPWSMRTHILDVPRFPIVNSSLRFGGIGALHSVSACLMTTNSPTVVRA